MTLPERIYQDPVAMALYVIRVGLLLLILLFLVACSSNRYLTIEEDNKMREVCGETRDCTVLPGNEWRSIENFLKRFGIEI